MRYVVDKAVVFLTDITCAFVDDRFEDLRSCGLEYGSLLGVSGKMAEHLVHTTDRNSARGSISRLVAVNKIVIPIGNKILGKMVEHEVGDVLMYVYEEVLLAVGVGDRESVNAPRMTSRPAGVVRVTLEGHTPYRRRSLGVELIVMEGRAVAADKVICCSSVVIDTRLIVLLVTCHLISPEEEGRVHK